MMFRARDALLRSFLAASIQLAALAGAAHAGELGLEGPGVAPLEQPVFNREDLRARAAPPFAILPEALDRPVFHAADLAAESTAPHPGLVGPVEDPRVVVDLSPAGAPPPFVVAPAPALALIPPIPFAPTAVFVDPAPPAAIRAALEAQLSRRFARGRAGVLQRKAREEMAGAYGAHGDRPFWIVDGRWTPAARGAADRLRRADEDGLDLGVKGLTGLGAPSVAAELELSEAVVAYARQAAGGRVEPWRVAKLITSKPPHVNVEDALARVAVAASVAAGSQALRDFNPPHPGYVALRDKLAELRRERPAQAREPIPGGPTLKVGMRDPRVPLIRSRLGLGPDDGAKTAGGEGLIYDTRVASAVKDFQRANGLPASGKLTARTIAALSGGEPDRLEAEIIANMERWRWLPRDLGAERIEVNIPDFALALKEGERTVFATRVVVGKPNSPTPVFSDLMRYLVVNPSWTMPPSILEKEALPHLAADPDYYAKRGYEVTWRNGKVSVRQPPGERNALGNIKFMFPNDHAVYLHDTPQRGLFKRDWRAFSHGCVRVDQPFSLAAQVMGGRWSEAALKKMVGRGERSIHLPEPLPIHLTYFTAKVDEDGRLKLSDDLYGYSRKLRAEMGLTK